jgi:phage terminase large subunit GpA-like protein
VIEHSSVRDLVALAARSAWAEPAFVTCAEWADRHRMIHRYKGSAFEPWSTARAPYTRWIMNAIHEEGVRRISIKKAEQVCGTEVAINIAMYLADRKPGPMLWIYPTEDLAKKAKKERLKMAFERTPRVARQIRPGAWENTTLEISMQRMTLNLAGSEATRGLETYPQRYRIVDELDRCKPGTLDVIAGRGVTFEMEGGSLDIALGTPEDEDEGIDALYKAGDRRTLWVPCRSCGAYHVRGFEGVKWLGGGDANEAEVRIKAYYRCPECMDPIHGHSNMWQLERGVFCPEGVRPRPAAAAYVLAEPWRATWLEDMLSAGVLEGKPAVRATGIEGAGHISFHVHGLYSPWVANPYGYVAAEFVKNQGAPTRPWATRRLGEEWKRTGVRIKTHELRAACAPVELGGVKMGEVSPRVGLLTAAVDVQKDRCYIEVIGHGERAEKKWAVWFGQVPRTPGDGLKNVWPVLLRPWPIIDRASGSVLGERVIDLAGIDSGWWTDEIYGVCRSRMMGGWGKVTGINRDGRAVACQVFPMKGHAPDEDQNGAKLAFITKFSQPEKGLDGKTLPQSVHLLNFDVTRFAQEHFDEAQATLRHHAMVEALRVQEEKRRRGERITDPDLLERGGPGGSGIPPSPWVYPEDLPDEYLGHLTSEERVPKKVKGVNVMVWRRISGRENHGLDCRRMNLALTHKFGRERIGGGGNLQSGVGSRESAEPEKGRPESRIPNPERSGGWMSGGGFV